MKIFIVEDEKKTLQSISKGLEEHGYEVYTASNAEKGISDLTVNRVDLIISDIILPGMSGLAFCKRLRETGIDTPVLLLSALSETDDKVTGFESGADLYLTKPFEFKELLAMVRSVEKKQIRTGAVVSKLHFADLEMDLDSKTVSRAGKQIVLTAKEFILLENFMRNPNKVLSRSELALRVWNLDFDTGTNIVEVYVNYLRKKIDRDFEKKLLHTHIGMGYILKES